MVAPAAAGTCRDREFGFKAAPAQPCCQGSVSIWEISGGERELKCARESKKGLDQCVRKPSVPRQLELRPGSWVEGRVAKQICVWGGDIIAKHSPGWVTPYRNVQVIFLK